MTTISVSGITKVIPEGVELLPNQVDLYSAAFRLIKLSDKTENNELQYVFSNPRHDGGHGFEKDDMQELCADIKEEGMLFPLICRWVLEGEELVVRVLDGERRWRCITELIEKGDKCWSRLHKKWLPAKEVYDQVPCCILTGNDKEALKIAFMVSDRAVSWGDGATAKLIKKLRKCGTSDEEILALTKKTGQWLREMDKICDLDDLTFTYLVENKINRTVALNLADVSDIERRHRYLTATYADAVEHQYENQIRAEANLAKAAEKEEQAEAQIAEAEEREDSDMLEDAQDRLQTASERREEKQQEVKEAQQPQGKTANLRRGAQHVAEEDEKSGQENDDTPIPPLRPGKIRKQLDTIEALIANDGKDSDGKDTLSVLTLTSIAACYNAILSGNEDIMKVIKRQQQLHTLWARRQTAKQEPESESEGEGDGDGDGEGDGEGE